MLIYYQCWKPVIHFQDSLMNKKLKNSIYLKYNFCYNIHYHSKAWGQYLIVFFFKKFVFIQQGFVKLIDTVIVKIYIVRKLLNKCCIL